MTRCAIRKGRASFALCERHAKESCTKGLTRVAQVRYVTRMTNNASGKAAQDRTILHASNRGLTWTDDEIAFLTDEANADETDEAIAYAIGRTLYAVWAMRYTLRHGGRDAVERMRTAHATVSRVDRVCDTCYLTRPACGCED